MPAADDLTFWGLFGPQPDYDYFADLDRHPFQPRATAFDRVHAWRMADAALLAYVVNREDIRRHCVAAGFSEVEFFFRESTHAYVAQSAAAAIVAFRGTDDYVDVLKDLQIMRVPSERGAQVHAGFKESLELIWPQMRPHLEELSASGRALWFTGHSLGAALATLAAGRIEGAHVVYTFGSPRVGDKRFAREFPVPVWRVVNNNDLVPHLPPPLFFRHVGPLRFIDSRGRLRRARSLWTRLRHYFRGHRARAREAIRRWKEGDLESLAYAGLIDHAPIEYARLLRVDSPPSHREH
jgi:hypothetical protein